MAEDEKVIAVFTRKEVADILAKVVERTDSQFLVEPRLEIDSYDIVLVSKEVE